MGSMRGFGDRIVGLTRGSQDPTFRLIKKIKIIIIIIHNIN